MDLLLQITLLAVGLSLLWKTGDLSVKNAIGFSVIYRVKSFTIGFFIFSISTGLPEITSALISSIRGVPELSSGNLIGSTFADVSIILGISAVIAKKLIIDPPIRKRLFPILGLILAIMIAIIFSTIANLYLGLALIGIYITSMAVFFAKIKKKTFVNEMIEEKEKREELHKKAVFSPKIDIFFKFFGSLLLLILSAWLTIGAAISIAKLMHVDLSVIGGTLIAIGTCLPELALDIHAVRRKEYGLALGDIFGSSLLNISLVLGLLIVVNPHLDLSFGRQVFPWLVLALALMVYRLIRKEPLKRGDGILLIIIFFLYLGAVTLGQLSPDFWA